ncbi:meiosis inhibitor protein 1 [Arapaima gigas]
MKKTECPALYEFRLVQIHLRFIKRQANDCSCSAMAARDVVHEKLHVAHEPRWSGRVDLADGQSALVCVACLVEIMERREVSSVRKAVALAGVSTVLKARPGALRELLMREYRMGLHLVGALLGMLYILKDPSVLEQIIEVSVHLLLELQSEQFMQYVLDEIQAQLRDQTSMRGFLPAFNFLGKLLDAVATLPQSLATHHVTLLEHLSMALLFPDEQLKSSVFYVFRKVWGCARAAQVIPFPLRDRLCALLLHSMHHACSPQLTINCLGFLKELLKMSEVVSVLMNCPADQDPPLSTDCNSQCNTELTVECCTLPLVLKKLLLNGDETLQVASAQCMASILVHSPSRYCPAFIHADIPEFLCERLCTRSEVLLWSVYSCLLLLAEDGLFFSQCYSVYGIEPLIRSLKELLTLNSVEVLKQGLLLLTAVLERQPVGVSLFGSGPSFAGAVEVLLGGVSSPCLRVAIQAASAATALLRLNHQSNPVQYKELQKLVWAVIKRCTELPFPTATHRRAAQTQKRTESRSQSSRTMVFLLQALVFFQGACSFAQQCAGHPDMVENTYTAPDQKSKYDTLESFCLHLLWSCDTTCIPTITRHCERVPSASILQYFFSILSSQFSLLPSMMPLFSIKLASSGFIGMALQHKAFFCTGNRNQTLNAACSDFLQRLSICLLSQLDSTEATPQKDCKECEELLQQCLPTLCIHPSHWLSVLRETPAPGESGLAVARLRTTQYCLLVLLHLALHHGDRLLPDSSVFSGTVSVLCSVQEHGDNPPPPFVRRAAFYLLSVTHDQSPILNKASLSCISKVMSCRPGLLSFYTHHPALLHFIFHYPELADSFGPGALEMWLTHLRPVLETGSMTAMLEPSKLKNDADVTVLLCLLEKNPLAVLNLLAIMCTRESQLAHGALGVLKKFLQGRPQCTASVSDLLRPRLLQVLQRLAVESSREARAPHPLSLVLQLLCLITISNDANTEMDSLDFKLLFHVSNLTGKLKLCDVESLLPAFNYLYCCLSLSPAHCADRAVLVLLCNPGLIEQLQAVLSSSPSSTTHSQPAPSLLCCAYLLLSSLLTLYHTPSAQVEKSISLSLGRIVQLLTFKKRKTDSFLLASSLRLLQILLDLDFQSPLLTLTDCTTHCPLDNKEALLHPLGSHRARCLLVALQGLLLQKQEFLLSVSVNCMGSLLAFLNRKSPLTVQHAVHQPWNRLLLYSLLNSGESSFLQPGILTLLSLLVRYGGENVLSEADLGQLLNMVEKKGVEELGGSKAQALKQFLTQQAMLSLCTLLVLVWPAFPSSLADSEAHRQRHDANLEIYKRLFETKRKDQLNALKNLVELNDINQQYKIIDIMLKGLFKVLEDSRAVLMAANLQPDDPFPLDDKVKEAYSHVLENTAFFGDVALRFPRIVHHYYDRNADWGSLLRWGLRFCNQTGVFAGGAHQHVLTLMSQELGITEKSPDFINPYRTERDDMLHTAEAFQKIMREEEKRRRKEEKRKEIRKGPRISRSRTEL